VDILSVFKNPELLTIFTYAPAGLGHLRVTDALYEGLPRETKSLLLGAHDASVGTIHRLVSVHPGGRQFMEWWQNGLPETLFTFVYRRWLRSHTAILYEQITTILDQSLKSPKTVLFISTHFGLAHQIATLKARLERERHIRLLLVVQVTDDSPQQLWYVPGADLIVVPSDRTARRLTEFAKQLEVAVVPIRVASYPISLHLKDALSPLARAKRFAQLSPGNSSQIHVSVPISGAAVGLTYFSQLVDDLHHLNSRFQFHVIVKSTSYTRTFISQMSRKPFVSLYTRTSDREIVDTYQEVYSQKVIGLEITKPSEQAFKALVTPRQHGGAIILFSRAIGRQEFDNLDFLRRHNLIPLQSERDYLWNQALNLDTSQPTVNERILNEAKNWRGVCIPDTAHQAAQFINWALAQGIFRQMYQCQVTPKGTDEHKHELRGDGVRQFWNLVAELVTGNNGKTS